MSALDKPTIGEIRRREKQQLAYLAPRTEQARRNIEARNAERQANADTDFEAYLDERWAANQPAEDPTDPGPELDGWAARDAAWDAADAEYEQSEVATIFIDWAEFWNTDHQAEEWIAYPLLPAHRQTAIYAPAKTGKSLLGLDVCLAVATGRPILGGDKIQPAHVMYLDYEMTEDDLKERIEDLGYDSDDDLSHFHYALQPALAPLDTEAGGLQTLQLAEQVEAELVVVDTFGRAVKGDENDADTVRNFYRNTGMVLKRAGKALLRMDHSGKDLEKGQRGSSAKNDDVDVIWQATRNESGLTLRRTHSRVRWVPETVAVIIEVDPVLRHRAVGAQRLYAAGTVECAALLDSLGLPANATTRDAQTALKAAGHATRRKVVCDTVRYRRESAEIGPEPSGTTPGTKQSTNNRNPLGTTPPKRTLTSTGTNPEPTGTKRESVVPVPPLSIAEPDQTSPPEPDYPDPAEQF